MKQYTIEQYQKDIEEFSKDKLVSAYMVRNAELIENSEHKVESIMLAIKYIRSLMGLTIALHKNWVENSVKMSDEEWLIQRGLLDEENHLHIDNYHSKKHTSGRYGMMHKMYQKYLRDSFLVFVGNHSISYDGSNIQHVDIANAIVKTSGVNLKSILDNLQDEYGLVGVLMDSCRRDKNLNVKLSDLTKLKKDQRIAIVSYILANNKYELKRITNGNK